jgi:prepilin-type N-terminal cleavage/methylation domain-containing protein
MKESQQNAFTLVELLTVIVIIGIMVAIGVPAITSLSKSGGLTAAARMVPNTLSLARQYAITQRTNTRVVFPYSLSAGVANSMWYSSFSILAKTNRYDNTTAQAWRYIGKWEYLPVGSVFLNSGVGALDDPSYMRTNSIPNPTNSAFTVTMACIEFTPTGAALSPSGSTPNTLALREGFQNTGTPTATSANAVTISVDNLVGRIKVTRP